MRVAAVVALLMAFALPHEEAGAAEPACHGKLSGAVSGEFDCVFRTKVMDVLTVAFEIRPKTRIEGVPAYAPGSFQLARPVEARTYTLDDMGPGKASAANEGTSLFTASKTTSQRGEVTLKLTSVALGPDGVEVLHGTYRARLLPAGSGKSGEVVVEVTF